MSDVKEMLKAEQDHWEKLLIYGGSDPFYPDSDGLNGTRGSIMSYQRKLEESGEEHAKDIHVPPKVPSGYMAKSREIWYGALRSCQVYEQDEDYQYLQNVLESLPKKVRKDSLIDNVIGYVSGIKSALKQKGFVTLRLHQNPERYQESFRDCRKRIAILLQKQEEKEEQMNLFQYAAMTQKVR